MSLCGSFARWALLGVLALTPAASPGAAAQEGGAPSPQFARYQLPEPTGPFPVGVTTWHWIDEGRPDPWAEAPGGGREMMAHAWYPARRAATATPAPYRPLARHDHDMIVKHSIAGASFADLSEKTPVVILCSGGGFAAEYNTAIAEELASHGFAVFALDSLHIAPVIFPDGRTAIPHPEFRPTAEFMMGPSSQIDAFFGEPVAIGASDLRFALDRISELSRRDPAGRFTGRLDPSRIGAFGHSMGGRLCGELAAGNKKVLAFASMEGPPQPETRRSGRISGAVLLMHSSAFLAARLTDFEEMAEHGSGDLFIARFDGLGHNSSTDLALFSDGFEYDVAPEEGMRLMRMALVDFFAANLRSGRFPSERLSREPRVSIRAFAEGAD